MLQTPVEFIRTQGLEHRQRAGQIIVKTCPICGDERWHFYMDPGEGGPWYCHKCGEKGNLITLRKHMGDDQIRTEGRETVRPAFAKAKTTKKPDQGLAEKLHQALLKDPQAVAYVEGRGITRVTAERFKLGLDVANGGRWLSIPHFQSRELVNIKFRSLPPAEKTFRRIAGCPSILFNGNCLKGQTEAFVCEGELDAITLIQAGNENTVSGSTGAGSFDPAWIDQLKHLKRIYLVYDADTKGQEGARALARRLGFNRCFNVQLPEGMDVNEYFQAGHDVFQFQALVNQARPFDLPGVVSVETGIDLLRRELQAGKADTGIMTPWPNVNALIRGFKPGDLIILTAPPKIGKTSFALDICRHQALAGLPALVFCLEMRPERLAKKLIQAHYRKELLTLEDLQRADNELVGLPLYFGHSFKKQALGDVLGLIKEAVQRYDLGFVVFDNLHFLIRSVSNVNEELGQAVQGFKLLAEEMEIPIMAIAQPRKRDVGGRDEVMGAEDIKYSNAVHADCDQMIILHRKRIASRAAEINSGTFTAKTESLDPFTLVRVEAHRYGPGGETLLYFHGDYSRFDLVEGGRGNGQASSN